VIDARQQRVENDVRFVGRLENKIDNSLDYVPFPDSTFTVFVGQAASERFSDCLAGKVFRGNQLETDSLSSFFGVNHLGQNRIKVFQRWTLLLSSTLLIFHGNHVELGG
jgi:hypothetical protein